jgi:hypothetical protein
MPYPERMTNVSLTRYASPRRGAKFALLTLMPQSSGTLPMPQTSISLVSKSYVSMPRSARMGFGKYSQRMP